METRNPPRAKKTYGATLLEMLVVCMISSIILLSVGKLIQVSVDYYFYATDQIEVQRNALLSLSLLTQELSQSSFESVVAENGGANPGLIFASASDSTGKVTRDAAGRLQWSKLVCYYIDDNTDSKALFRKEELLATPTSTAPDPIDLGVDVSHFRSLADPGRIMARGISKIESQELTDAVNVIVTAEVNQGRNWLEMDVDTTIVPRN